MANHIELFPGSITGLERMTDRDYKAMENEKGELLRIDARNITPRKSAVKHPRTYDDARESLTELARKAGADALVQVTYVPTIELGFTNKPMTVAAFGYAVEKLDMSGLIR